MKKVIQVAEVQHVLKILMTMREPIASRARDLMIAFNKQVVIDFPTADMIVIDFKRDGE